MTGSDHFDGKKFFNPGAPQARGLTEVLRWKLTTRPTPWPKGLQPVTPSVPPAVSDALRVTFINHSTVLIQVSGYNILTDPIWSERASPISLAGPKRHREPGVRWQDLPPIHLVLLSHNHYDHLDIPTVKRLAARDNPQFVVPLGLADLLRRNGAGKVIELDWWDEAEADGIQFSCVPAQHFSARGLTDRNRTLWCGYVVDTSAGPVYFAGDTGFGSHFAEVRQRKGAPRLALLPIGAYKPRWFMSPVHMSPADAVQAHGILQAQTSLAIHFGTFSMADDGMTEPVRDLQLALEQDKAAAPFLVFRNGESALLESI